MKTVIEVQTKDYTKVIWTISKSEKWDRQTDRDRKQREREREREKERISKIGQWEREKEGQTDREMIKFKVYTFWKV